MKKTALLAIILFLFLSIGLAGNAFAVKVKFTGDADWLTSEGLFGGGDQWLNIEKASIPLPLDTYQKVKIKGIKFQSMTPTDQFGDLAFLLDTERGKIKKLIKKAQKQGLDEADVEAMLAGETFKIKLKTPDGDKYRGRLTFGELMDAPENGVAPTSVSLVDNQTGEGSSAIPEPATMILLGAGILGLAGCRRIRRK